MSSHLLNSQTHPHTHTRAHTHGITNKLILATGFPLPVLIVLLWCVKKSLIWCLTEEILLKSSQTVKLISFLWVFFCVWEAMHMWINNTFQVSLLSSQFPSCSVPLSQSPAQCSSWRVVSPCAPCSYRFVSIHSWKNVLHVPVWSLWTQRLHVRNPPSVQREETVRF